MVKMTKQDVFGILIILAVLALVWYTPVKSYSAMDEFVQITALPILLIAGGALIACHMKPQTTKQRNVSALDKKMLFRFIGSVVVLSIVFFLITPLFMKGLSEVITIIPFSVVPAIILSLLFIGLHYPVFGVRGDEKEGSILTLDFITITIISLVGFLAAFHFLPVFPGAFSATSNTTIVFVVALAQTSFFALFCLIAAKLKILRLKNFLSVPNWMVFLALIILIGLSWYYQTLIPILHGARA